MEHHLDTTAKEFDEKKIGEVGLSTDFDPEAIKDFIRSAQISFALKVLEEVDKAQVGGYTRHTITALRTQLLSDAGGGATRRPGVHGCQGREGTPECPS